MAIDMSTVKTIVNNGNNKEIIKIEDSLGRVLWQKAAPTATLYASLGQQATSSSITNAQGKLINNTPDYFEQIPGTSLFPQVSSTAYNMSAFWTDGEYWYVDNGSGGLHYKYDFTNLSRTEVTWNIGNYNVEAKNIWTDGTDIYLGGSNGVAYVFDKTNKTWSSVNFTGDISTVYGENIWTDGTDIYYLYSGSSYVFNKATRAWSSVTFTGTMNVTSAKYIWTDGTNIFYDDGYYHYQLDIPNRVWSAISRSFSYLGSMAHGIYTTGYGIYYTYGDGENNTYKINGNTITVFNFKWDNNSGKSVYVRGLMSSDPHLLYPYLTGCHTTFKLLMFN